MRCPYCGGGETRVIETREPPERGIVRRRRSCEHCGERFTTCERVEARALKVVKRNGRRESFAEEKLRAGIERALEKRPVPAEDVESLVGRLLGRVARYSERELPTPLLGEWVMAELRDLDEVAYVRFASVYHEFQDLDAFRREIELLKGHRAAHPHRARASRRRPAPR